MKIAIAGGTGLIGRRLTEKWQHQGHDIYILTRDASNKKNKPRLHYIEWLKHGLAPENELEGVDAIVNLAGESLASGRWTTKRKTELLNSRILSTRALIHLISNLSKKPSLFINASAIGYYGTSVTKTFTEASTAESEENNFLASVVKQWEDEAKIAQQYRIRSVFCRFGIVLHEKEGALAQMVLPYRMFAGGTLGSGKQWLSWIHIDDAVGLIDFALENKKVEGPLNVTAPTPLQMKHFGQTIAEVLNRPHWLPAPALAIKLVLGDMSTLVLDGQKVLPQKAETLDYPFQYRQLKPALEHLLT